MGEPIRIVIVEDMVTDAELAVRELRRSGMNVDARRVETSEDFLTELQRFKPHVVLSDFTLPRFDGLSALALSHQHYPELPFIFVSGTIGDQTAIDALKGGASDYVLKSNLVRLGPAVRRAVDDVSMRTARRQAELRFRDLIEFAPDAMVVVNEHGRIEIVNEQVELLFGYERSEIIGAPSEMLIPLRFRQWHDLMLGDNKSLAEPGRRLSGFEICGQRKDGTEFPAEVSLSPLKTETGLWVSSVIRDISQRKAQEEQLARLSRIHTVVSGINMAIVRIRDRQQFLDEACRIAVENGPFAAAWVGMLDPATREVAPQAWAGLQHEGLQAVRFNIDEEIARGRGVAATALRTKLSALSNDLLDDEQPSTWHDFYLAQGYRSLFVVPLLVEDSVIGVLCFCATRVDVFNDEEQRLLTELGEDISFALDHFDKDEQLNYLAYYDPLTGLPNRALFQDRLGQLILQETGFGHRQIAIVLIDLERFRNINATLGRSAGDELLREVANRIQGTILDPGYLARISADCFAMVVKDCWSVAEVTNLLERNLTACLATPVKLADKDIRISVRAGIALFPSDGTDVDTLLRNAEAALKDAKTWKARYRFYTAEMNAQVAEKLSIENRLRRALNEEQFVLHYQPKIDLASGEIVGLEALIRWNEPGVGLVAPGQFIHVLEETGFIVDVGNWVIARVHEQYRDWVSRGIDPPRIAVNVSQLQIRQRHFVSNFLRTLDWVQDEGMDIEIEIEITESLFMEDMAENIAKLAELRAMGITVAIDDFGTGYSSLSNIMHLPVDVLKIDRSFIQGMATSSVHLAIVSTLISLAHSLELKVVAEGVETEEQSRLLTLLRCDQIQGYIFSPGLAPELIEDRLPRRVRPQRRSS